MEVTYGHRGAILRNCTDTEERKRIPSFSEAVGSVFIQPNSYSSAVGLSHIYKPEMLI